MSNKFWFAFSILFGFGLSATAGYFDVPFEARMAALFAAIFATVVGGLIGTVVGYFLARDADVDTNGFKIVAWSGLLGWLIPVVGTTLATITYMFKRQSTDNRGFYNVMSNIAGLLAVTNATIGAGLAAYEGMAAAQTTTAQAEMNSELKRLGIEPEEMTGERSSERCQYAALEAWSSEEIDRYC